MLPSNPPNTPRKGPSNAQFRNGVWYCNCIPRLPAVQFTVRKDTKNKGRSFYTCQKDKDKKNKCDFFLWSEDAYKLEVGAILTNSSKKQRTLHESITPAKEKRAEKTPITSISELNRMLGYDQSKSPGSARSSTLKGSPVSDKKIADDLVSNFSSDEDDDLFGPSFTNSQLAAAQNTPSMASKRKREEDEEYDDFSSGEEEALVSLTDSSVKNHNKSRNVFATPSASRTPNTKDGILTPLTEKPVRRVLFEAEGSKDAKRLRTEGFASLPQSSPEKSTTTTSAFTSPSSSQNTTGKGSADLTADVMSLLEGQGLDETVLLRIRGTLDKHAARARGLEKGRDASRDAVKKADARVAELQGRVTHLENQRKLDSEARQKMRTDLMKLYCES
ncbi:hypothetical protein M426DRAFT_318678 [Hypoxylon sp. CI-4A]|nr:hypothetical protein M426DRAFT_318678 [Hypoxylon sp. CI-4A]